jgi:pyridoxamine 5'-phosphate oxidase
VTDVPLRRLDLDPDPVAQFSRWYAEATEAEGYPRVDAIALATSTRDGRPAARLVLFKGIDERGLVFHTNYESRKGRELQANPLAAVAFFWPELHRQVRAAGPVARLSSEESDVYFASRPREARLAALSSHQSEVIDSREALEARYRELEARYGGEDVPRPSFWGGLRLAPDEWEFWQGRVNRLHDRFRYRGEPGGGWIVERLAP